MINYEKEEVAGEPIHGNFGECQICGESFLMNTILGIKYIVFEMPNWETKMAAHKTCAEKYNGVPIMELPESSPMRKALEKAVKEEKVDEEIN